MGDDDDICGPIEACRTCGIYFVTSENFLRAIRNSEMVEIRMLLSQWNVEIDENDFLPQSICTCCIYEFNKFLKFRNTCLEVQRDLLQSYHMRNKQNIKIKTEVADTETDAVANFIYVDDLSDNENDGDTLFTVPHIPIKKELNEIDESTMPKTELKEDGNTNDFMDGFSQIHMVKKEKDEHHVELQNVPMSLKNTTGNLQCNICFHTSLNQDEHRQHMIYIHEINNFECHICGKQFKNSTKARLIFHLKWHKISKHIKCTQCGFYCISRKILNQHKRNIHTKNPCNICGKRIYAKKMQRHMQMHSHNDDLECGYCDLTFKNILDREKHIWQVHAVEDFNEYNKEDTFSTNTITELEDSSQRLVKEDQLLHIVDENENGSEIMSNINDEMNCYSENLLIGTDSGLENIAGSQYVCAQCSIPFDNIDELRRHYEVHTEKPLFKCSLCLETFNLQIKLNRHMSNH